MDDSKSNVDISKLTYFQAFLKISGSLFAMMAVIIFGYLYFLSTHQFDKSDFLLKFTTYFTLTVLTTLLLIQILFFSQNEINNIKKYKLNLVMALVSILLILLIFIASVRGFINLL